MQSERHRLGAGSRSHLEPAPINQIALWMRPADLAEYLFGDSLVLLRSLCLGAEPAVLDDLHSERSRRALQSADVLITGWGVDPLTIAELSAAPRLAAVLHAGGQAASVLPTEAWSRGLQIGNAGMANAIPVAEYTLAMILLAARASFEAHDLYRERRHRIDREVHFADAGNYDRTVGIIGASRIGRLVMGHLQTHHLRVLVYDPYTPDADLRALGAVPIGLKQLMAESETISLHVPANDETKGMIDAELLASMKDGATIINTSRGVVVDQDALVAELQSGRIRAILDVTDPEVLDPSSPLYDLPNVFLTPHIAGSMGRELRRLGTHVADELGRLKSGLPLRFPEPPPPQMGQ